MTRPPPAQPRWRLGCAGRDDGERDAARGQQGGSYAISQAGATLEVNSERRVDDRFDLETGQTNPSGWHVIAENPDTSESGTITVYVNCAPVHTP